MFKFIFLSLCFFNVYQFHQKAETATYTFEHAIFIKVPYGTFPKIKDSSFSV